MRRLDRYVLRAFLVAFGAAFVFFTGMYLVIHFFNKLGDLSEAAEAFRAQGWSPLQGLCLYYALNVPFVIVQTAPFTVLMGAMWAAQQMARRNELVPVLMAGVSLRRLALPLLLCGFLLSLLFAGVREELLPAIAAERHRVERIYKGKEDDVMRRLPQIRDGAGRIFRIREYDVTDRVARGVDVVDPERRGALRRHFPVLRWEDGRWRVPDGGDGTAPVLRKTDLHPRDVEIESRSLLFLDVAELRRMIARYPYRSDLRLLLHSQFAYPFATVVLLMMGLPLVLRGTRTSPFVAAGASLLISIAFFAVQSVTQDLGARGEVLDPVLGAWLPVVVFGSVGLLLFETTPT